jgi:3-oxoisoapionate kinase
MNTSGGNLATDGLLVAYYADDFTGSTDALEWLCRAGLRTVLFIEPPTAEQLARYPGLRAIGVAGQTRSMSPAQMEATLRPAFGRLRELGARHVHYKVCSTFDSSPSVGSIGRALDVGAEVFESDFIPLLVGVPPLGRYCLFGNLFARMGIGSSGKIYRLDRHPSMSRHPVTPADESDLRLHLSRQTAQSVGLFDILQLSRPEPEARAALTDLLTAEQRIVLFDVLYTEQLRTIGRLIDARAKPGRPLFSVGSSGIEIALAAHWTSEGAVTTPTGWPELPEAKPLLVLSGSCSPVTEGQIAWAVREGFAEVGLSAAQMVGGGRDDHALALTVGHLKAGRSVVVHTSRGCSDPDITAAGREALGAALGEFGRAVLAQVAVRRLVIAGGDSSSHAARALGIEAVEMIAPLSPGAPLCRALAPGSPVDGLEVNFKGGQVGAENYFGALARGKL